MNLYGKCTNNKIINGKQFIIQWYVDENKATHVSDDVMTGVINITKNNFGELVMSHGNKNTFIGMDI